MYLSASEVAVSLLVALYKCSTFTSFLVIVIIIIACGLTVDVKSLLLFIHHIINTTLIFWQYRLGLGWIEPVCGEDHVNATGVRLGFHQRRRQRSCKTTAGDSVV